VVLFGTIPMPFIDEIILWAQRRLDMELLVNGADGKYQLAGRAVNVAPPHCGALVSTPLKTSSRTRSSRSDSRSKKSVRSV